MKKTTFIANGLDILQQFKNKPKIQKFEEQIESNDKLPYFLLSVICNFLLTMLGFFISHLNWSIP